MYKTYLQYYVAKEAGASSQLLKQLTPVTRNKGLWGGIKNFFNPGSSSMLTYDGKNLTRGAIARMNTTQKRELLRSIRENGDFLADNFGGHRHLAPYLEANRASMIRHQVFNPNNNYNELQKQFADAQLTEYAKGMRKYRDYQNAYNAYRSAPKNNREAYRAALDNAINAYNWQIGRANSVSDMIRNGNRTGGWFTQYKPMYNTYGLPFSWTNQVINHK